MTFKQKIHIHYLQLVQDRIDVFKDMIVALTEDSKNDAKGSAGDKHETALSMMHIEQEKLNRKLREVLEAAGSRYRMHDPTTWPEQANLAAEGKMEELKTLQDSLKGGKAE